MSADRGAYECEAEVRQIALKASNGVQLVTLVVSRRTLSVQNDLYAAR